MDFTFLILVIFMLLAAQNGNLPITIAIFAMMLVVAKSKYLIAAAIVGIILTVILNLEIANKEIYILGGLFVILLLILKTDNGQAPQYGGGGYY